ncbi:hypothetical protein EV426DRAFT_706044 [Tirmania nivea]|nr:hypothetical protein EV426DRAFT_706044 [Tirmania nivea]
MVTAKHLIKNSKADLGWDTRDADYTAWQNAVKDYCAQYLIRTWSGASEAQRDALVIAVRTLTGFQPSMRGRLAAGSEFHKKALEALLQDCLKKRSETAKNLAIKRARKRVHAESEDSDGTLDGIWDIVKAYIPPNCKVREILRALEDPSPLNPTFPADHTSLNSDAEVTAFLRISKANPVRIMVVLYALDGRENSLPLHSTAAFFAQDRFDPPNEYDDPAEDSDALVRVSAGVRKCRMPTKDHTFEQRGIQAPLDPLLTPNNSLDALLPQKNSSVQDSIQKPIHIGRRSRSIFNIPDQYRDTTARAAAFVRYYIFFENPMLNPNEIAQLVLESWADAIQETGQNLESLKKLCSIYSRTHAHLVYEYKKCIIEVYKLNHLSQAEIADNVEALLFQDRFICRQDGRETDQRHFRAQEIMEVIFRKYFSRIKMQGNFDNSFFDSINEVFICLVTSAMRHCLKGWTTGVYEEPSKSQEFKYETTIRIYKRFLATWEAHSLRMCNLLLATIKADLRERLIATQPKMDLESDQALTIDNSSRFEQELT